MATSCSKTASMVALVVLLLLSLVLLSVESRGYRVEEQGEAQCVMRGACRTDQECGAQCESFRLAPAPSKCIKTIAGAKCCCQIP